ncbi:MAG: DUF3093 domain-containing protein [Actinomycetota bacterium]
MAVPRATRTYVERLTPAPWVWLAVLPVAASSGLVVLTAFGARVAVPVAVVAVAVAAWALLRTSAVVSVDDGQLVAGRARIPVGQLGAVRELDPAQMSALRGPRADARAYLCQRGWIAAGFAVEVADPADPVPFWLVSSRHPARACAALLAEIERCAAGQAHSRQTS